MFSRVTPWKPAESGMGQLARVVGYGATGLFLGIAGTRLGRLRSIALTSKALRRIQATLIGAGILAEGAALISTIAGVKKQSGGAEPINAMAELYNQINADEPDPVKIEELCNELGAEGLSRAWGDQFFDADPEDTPLVETIHRMGTRQNLGRDASQQIAMLELMLDSGASTAPQGTEKWSPVEYAMQTLKNELQDQVVKLLMSQGARFPTWSADGYPLKESIAVEFTEHSQRLFDVCLAEDLQLLEAARNGDLARARELLEAGCHPEIRDGSDDEGRSALQIAVSEGDLEMVKLLLEFNASVENYGPSPLSLAIDSDEPDLEIVQTLLEAGANVLFDPVKDVAPPVLAALLNHPDVEVTRLLVKRAREQHLKNLAAYQPVDRTEAEDTGLDPGEKQRLKMDLLAAMRLAAPDLKTIRGLAHRLGTALNEPIELSKKTLPPPLVVAIAMCPEAVTKILLEEGADPNWTNAEGFSAFHTVVLSDVGYTRQNAIVQLLLEHGGHIPTSPPYHNARSGELKAKCSRFLYELIVGQAVIATKYVDDGIIDGDVECVRRYLDDGFPVDFAWFDPAKGGERVSVLSKACKAGHVDVVRMLLEAGVPVRDSDIEAAGSNDDIRALLQ